MFDSIRRVVVAAVAVAAGALVLVPVDVGAAPPPTTVTLVGSLQSELGCTGDFDPGCAVTHLTRSANSGVWVGSFALPAGTYAYKIAVNDSFDENYGAGGTAGGANLDLVVPSGGATVRFYFDESSHWIADDAGHVIATLAGSFQSELGCSSDFNPGCLASLLEDLDGDGVSTLTRALPAGDYSTKVAIDESFDVNYGAGGVPGGANIDFTVPPGGATVTFQYDETTHVLTILGLAGTDTTSPTITFTGNAGTYDVDGTVAIACVATDADSGVASSTCPGASGPASSFGPGAVTLTGTATDHAGNVGTGTTTFVVRPTAGGLCRLTRSIVTSAPRYLAAGRASRFLADTAVTLACRALDGLTPPTTATRRALALASYQLVIGGFTRSGWLSSAQGQRLFTFARAI